MTPEQTVALIAALIGIVVAVPTIAKALAGAREKDASARLKNAEAAFIDAQTRQKNAEAEALREKAEVDTNQKVFGTITDTITAERNEKIQLRVERDTAREERDTARINWQNALTISDSKTERITILEDEKRALLIELENTRHRLEHCLDKDDNALSDFDDLADTQRID
jgi:type II secretory pathway pseudopilin PulG